jgi:periplasmic divalent cation tolerance protein
MASRVEARAIAAALLDARLVASANLVDDVQSFYWWRGRQEATQETLLLAKTRRELFPTILEAVRSLHSYEVFGLLALPVLESNPEYARWVVESTRSAGPIAPGEP